MATQELPKSEIYLRQAENVILTAVLLDALLILLRYEYKPLTYGLVAGLALVYFLHAFLPPKLAPTENQPVGFNELLAWTILPKVMYIGIAIVTLGILLFYANVQNKGYEKLLTVGCGSLSVSLFLLAILAFNGVKQLHFLRAVVFKALLFLLGGIIALYLF